MSRGANVGYACPEQRPTEILQPRAARNRPAEPESQEIPANALLAQLVEHFHGKEGVVGSSPTPGLALRVKIAAAPGKSAAGGKGHMPLGVRDRRTVCDVAYPTGTLAAHIDRGRATFADRQ